MKGVIVPEIFDGKVAAFFTGKTVGADPREIGRLAGISSESVYLPTQKHTDTIVFLSAVREPRIGDAVITRERGVMVGVQVADCVPVLIHERGKRVIAAVHAGWRGTAAAILRKTVEAIIEKYAGEPKDVIVAIGPAIGGCSYEVGREVIDGVKRATGEGDYYSKKGDKYYLDLPAANKRQVLSLGVPPENIWVSSECTFCSPDRFYSYRFLKGSAGRQGGFIGMV